MKIKEYHDIKRFINVRDTSKLEELEKTITVERRTNNSKRDFLFVNRFQGKHIPCSPSETIDMVGKLTLGIIAKRIELQLETNVAIVIGMAETATGIASLLAHDFGADILVTTRETLVTGDKLFEFKEEHSHAVEQCIYVESLEAFKNKIAGKKVQFIIVDDEMSTGKTAKNFVSGLIDLIEEMGIEVELQFMLANICDWSTDDKDFWNVKGHQIEKVSIFSGDLIDSNMKVDPDNEYISVEAVDCTDISDMGDISKVVSINPYKNFRLGYDAQELMDVVYDAWNGAKELLSEIAAKKSKLVRVVGSEECMLLGLQLAYRLTFGLPGEYSIEFHASTRSPISPVNADKSSLYSKAQVQSAYDKDRVTYLYNTETPDDTIIVVVTDGNRSKEFTKSVAKAYGANMDRVMLVEACN